MYTAVLENVYMQFGGYMWEVRIYDGDKRIGTKRFFGHESASWYAQVAQSARKITNAGGIISMWL